MSKSFDKKYKAYDQICTYFFKELNKGWQSEEAKIVYHNDVDFNEILDSKITDKEIM